MRELLSLWRETEVLALVAYPTGGDVRFKDRWHILAMSKSKDLLLIDATYLLAERPRWSAGLLRLSPIRGPLVVSEHNLANVDFDQPAQIIAAALGGDDNIVTAQAYLDLLSGNAEIVRDDVWADQLTFWQQKEMTSEQF